jgi:hypothetical protein
VRRRGDKVEGDYYCSGGGGVSSTRHPHNQPTKLPINAITTHHHPNPSSLNFTPTATTPTNTQNKSIMMLNLSNNLADLSKRLFNLMPKGSVETNYTHTVTEN